MAEKPEEGDPARVPAEGTRTGETERTLGGLEVPIPTREEFFGNLRKAARPAAQDDQPGGRAERT